MSASHRNMWDVGIDGCRCRKILMSASHTFVWDVDIDFEHRHPVRGCLKSECSTFHVEAFHMQNSNLACTKINRVKNQKCKGGFTRSRASAKRIQNDVISYRNSYAE